MSEVFAPDYEDEDQLLGDWGDADVSGIAAMDVNASFGDATEADAAANMDAALRAARIIEDAEMVVVEV